MTLQNGNNFLAHNPNWKWPSPLRKGLNVHLQLEKIDHGPEKTVESREGKNCYAHSPLINKKFCPLTRNRVYLSQVSEENIQ